jgi:hypothetical protein
MAIPAMAAAAPMEVERRFSTPGDTNMTMRSLFAVRLVCELSAYIFKVCHS